MRIDPLPFSVWYRVALDRGEDLIEALRAFTKKEGLKEAYVLSCIGSLERVVLAYPKAPSEPIEIGTLVLEGLFEINGISGSIKKEGDAFKVHLHGSLSRAGKEVVGGAIYPGTRILRGAELVIGGIKG